MDLENLSDDQLAELLNAKYAELQSAEAKVYRALFPDFRRELLAAQKAGHVYGDPEARAVWELARASWQDLTGLPALVDLPDWKRAALKVGYNPATFASAGWPSMVEWLVAWAENLQTEPEEPGDPIDGVLSGQAVTLYRRLAQSKHHLSYDTLADLDCWRNPPPDDATVLRGLRKLQTALNNIGGIVTLRIENEHRRAKICR